MVTDFDKILAYTALIFVVVVLPILLGPKNNNDNGTGLGGI